MAATFIIGAYMGKLRLTVDYMGSKGKEPKTGREIARIELPEGHQRLSLDELRAIYAKQIEAAEQKLKEG